MLAKIFRENLKLFRLIDFLMPGSLGPISTVIAIIIALGTAALSIKIMMFVLSLAFWFIYGMILFERHNFLKTIDYITSDGVGIITNGFNIDKAIVESIVKNTISQWHTVTKWEGIPEAIYGTVVVFKQPPLVLKGRTYNGYTINNICTISHIDNDINRTAMSHELGHIIYNAWTGTYLNDECHKFMTDNKLP